MPSKKKKYNARFPAGRIKKIMQTDEEVGKVAQAVPVIISRTLELFVESLLTKSMQITQARSAKTLTPSHMKQCILSESRFDFLKDLVKNIPDPSVQEDNENNEIVDYSLNKIPDNPPKMQQDSKVKSESTTNLYMEQGTSTTPPVVATASRTPVIQYGPRVAKMEQPKLNFSIENIVNKEPATEPKFRIDLTHVPIAVAPAAASSPSTTPSSLIPPTPPPPPLSSSQATPVPQLITSVNNKSSVTENVPASTPSSSTNNDNIPPLIPISHNNIYGQSSSDNNLYIDEDYDN